ncbi:MAG: DUF3499 family protein [Microthrixaceae bacterium]
MSRSCARPGCGKGAVATLSYAYANSVVVLDDLAAESHPMVHDLCNMHAGSIRVPMGWTLQDTRAPAPSDTHAVDSSYGRRTGAEGASPLRLVGA